MVRDPSAFRAALPAFGSAARAELDRGATPHACWAVLYHGADSDEARALRPQAAAALAEDRPDPWRQLVANALLAHLNRQPDAVDPLRPALIAAVEAESRGGREPIAALLVAAVARDPAAWRAAVVAIVESLERPMPDTKRAEILSLLWSLADGAEDLRPTLEAYRDHESPAVAEGAAIMLDRLGEGDR